MMMTQMNTENVIANIIGMTNPMITFWRFSMRNEYCDECNKTGYNMIRYVNYREYRYCEDCGEGSFNRRYPKK